jgi:excisionase family DNA binding protein
MTDNAVPIEARMLLRISEAAALCSVSEATMYRRIRTGDVPTVRFGDQRLVRRRDLELAVGQLRSSYESDRPRLIRRQTKTRGPFSAQRSVQ